MTDNSKRIRMLEIFENKINILEKMMNLEKNNQLKSNSYRELANKYKEENLKYQTILSSLDEKEKNDIMTIFNMTFDNINVNLHFNSFLETDLYATEIKRILIDINDGFNNMYKNDIFEAIDNDAEIKGGLLCLNKNANNALELINLEFLISFYNILSEKIEINSDNRLLNLKYNLILLFGNLEEEVINNNFSNKIKVDYLYSGYDGAVYHITRDMINVAIIKKLLYDNKSENIDDDLLVIEVLSSCVKSKERCKALKKDLEKYEKKHHVLNKEQKQKLKSIIIK